MARIIFSVVISTLIFTACQSPEGRQEVQSSQSAIDTTAALSPDARLATIKAELKTVKANLTAAGKYDCCVQPPCDWCALKEGECPCHDNLLAKKAVCPDCGLGWHNGQGVVEGVSASQVKWNITHEHATGGQHKH
jgi:hypothetical protein